MAGSTIAAGGPTSWGCRPPGVSPGSETRSPASATRARLVRALDEAGVPTSWVGVAQTGTKDPYGLRTFASDRAHVDCPPTAANEGARRGRVGLSDLSGGGGILRVGDKLITDD